MEHRCFLTGRHRVILFKGALRHMFELECLLDYLGNTIVFISWTACGILKCKIKYFTCSWSGFQMFNKQGMVFYLASTILTNGQYPYIYTCSSAVVKQCVYNRFTNCHTYYLFIFRLEKIRPVRSWFFTVLELFQATRVTAPLSRTQIKPLYVFINRLDVNLRLP